MLLKWINRKGIRRYSTEKVVIDAFKRDIREKLQHVEPQTDLDSEIKRFESVVRSVLDSHAPIIQRNRKRKPIQPWYDDEIHSAKRLRRSAERKWKQKPSSPGRTTLLKRQTIKVNKLIVKKKTQFHTKKVKENANNPKALFKSIGNMLNNAKQTIYPQSKDNKTLANKFLDFFKTKIEKISATFGKDSDDQATEQQCPARFDAFRPLLPDEVKRYILSAPSKSSILDALPTDLLKSCIEEVLPSITRIVNRSLEQGYIPRSLKQAIVTPIPKKPNCSEFSNFRPISNLPFLSKLIERIVVDQLSNYSKLHDLDEPLQSAYKTGYSTETALLRITNDMLLNMDNQRVTLLVLLDMSAAFDTIPHHLFLTRINRNYGVSGTALHWFESYFEDRYQCVTINGELSDENALEIGLPQGAGAGPFAYKVYTKPIGSLIRSLSSEKLYHMFADDNQLWRFLNPNSISSQIAARSQLEMCINGLSAWLYQNRLKLNESKKELLIIGKKAHIAKMSYDTITIGNETIKATPCAKNLGVFIDEELSMRNQIISVVKRCNYQLRVLWSIRRFIDIEAAKTLATCLILSRLDYCNSLYFGLPDVLLEKLQKVQNSAARFVFKMKKIRSYHGSTTAPSLASNTISHRFQNRSHNI